MAEESRSKEWILQPETEYRFELDPGSSLAIKLVRGNAEIFGAELAEGKAYLFGTECKAAVFTWQGCTLEMSLPSAFATHSIGLICSQYVTGKPTTEYVSEETPMAAYGNLHIAFEQMRVRALRKLHGSLEDDKAEPPRVLVLGPENSGKTTVCKILTNYAVRSGQGWCPLLVNADPGEGGWAVPGTLSVAPIQDSISTYSPALPLGSAATSAPMSLSSNALTPLVYWFGHTDIRRNPLLMDRLIRNMGENINDRLDADPEAGPAGLIVDTPSSFVSGLTNDQRQKLIKACVDAFKINVILVVGHEKLNVEMQRLHGESLTVVKIPKSGGVVELDHGYRERMQNHQLHTYMYGIVINPPHGASSATLGGEALADLVLSPSATVIEFSDLHIHRIGAEALAPSSALPIGAARVVSEMQPVIVDASQPGSRLLNAVLALMAPFNEDENERYDEEILDLTVAGFVVVTNLDVPNKKMSILAPNQGSVAGKTAIVGSLEWQDQ